MNINSSAHRNGSMPGRQSLAAQWLHQKLKVLIYSQDGLGLGHIRRNLSIVYQIKKLCPSASVLIIADSPAAPFFELPPRCDFIKIPTIVKIDYGVWQSDRLQMNPDELLPVRSEIIQNVAINFRPHIFLVDHMPQGVMGELAGPLQMMRRFSPQTLMVLGLRDILGAPEDIQRQWQKEGAYQLAEQYYDRVLIYGCKDVYDFLREYRLPPALAARAIYCGYVCREGTPVNFGDETLKKLYPAKTEKLILVTGGGGYDAGYLMDTFLEALRLLKKSRLEVKAIVSQGPFTPHANMQLLRQKARGLPVTVAMLGEDIIHFLKRADLVISMAGYNTVGEIMHFRKNAIIVPRSGPSKEQTIRTDLLSARGIFSAVHARQLAPREFADLIVQRLEKGVTIPEERLPELKGAQNAATQMMREIVRGR